MIVFLFVGLPVWLDKMSAIVTGLIILMVGLKDTPPPKRSRDAAPYVEHRSEASKMEKVERPAARPMEDVRTSDVSDAEPAGIIGDKDSSA